MPYKGTAVERGKVTEEQTDLLCRTLGLFKGLRFYMGKGGKAREDVLCFIFNRTNFIMPWK